MCLFLCLDVSYNSHGYLAQCPTHLWEAYTLTKKETPIVLIYRTNDHFVFHHACREYTGGFERYLDEYSHKE